MEPIVQLVNKTINQWNCDYSLVVFLWRSTGSVAAVPLDACFPGNTLSSTDFFCQLDNFIIPRTKSGVNGTSNGLHPADDSIYHSVGFIGILIPFLKLCSKRFHLIKDVFGDQKKQRESETTREAFTL